MSNEFNQINEIERAAKNIDVAINILGKKQHLALYRALVALLEEARRESQILLQSLDDFTSASLSVRNLFEILLISKHIHSDRQALENWYGQLHRDFKDINDGFIGRAKKSGADTSGAELMQQYVDKSLAQTPFKSVKSFNMRDLAEQYGYLEDYQFVYKLNSKLIHPTAMKVMMHEAIAEGNIYLTIVIHTGVYFWQELSEFLIEVVTKHVE